jgi:hypothetical protein
LSDDFPANNHGRDLPKVVSVSFKPEALSSIEEWRMVLCRLLPGSRRPVLRLALNSLFVVGYLTFVGYLIGQAGWPRLQPETMATAFFLAGLLYPFRAWRIKRKLVKMLRELGPMTIELDQESATIRAKHRLSRIDWAGIIEVRANHREIVLRFKAGDASWLPTWAFADPDHEARFLQLADFGLNSHRHDPASQPSQAAR